MKNFLDIKKTNNYFMCNGSIVELSKTVKENKIKYGNIILMTITEEDEGLRVVN